MMVQSDSVIFQNEICTDLFRTVTESLEAVKSGGHFVQQKVFRLFDTAESQICKMFSLSDIMLLSSEKLESMFFQLEKGADEGS